MADLAVIIVSWNVRELLAACLRSLIADLERTPLTHEVWVVDNGSADGTAERVRETFPTVRLIASDENLGFVGGNNRALAAILDAPAVPRYVWLLNPDTVVRSGATSALTAPLAAEPELAVSGAKLLYPDGSLQHSGFRFPGLLQLAFDLYSLPERLYDTPLNGRYPRHLYQRGAPFYVDHPLGAAMMVRMRAIEEVGLMDEGFFMYCEEIDWCWRMREAGWRACCVPTAEVIHHAGQSSGQVEVSSFVNLWTSRARLYARHHRPPAQAVAKRMVRGEMRRRARGAPPRMAEACRQVIAAWEERL